MTSSKKNRSPRILMIFGALPPMAMGGAEMQGIKLCKRLNAEGIETQVIAYGKIWHGRKGEYQGIPFTRIRSLINLITDIPSLFKRKTKPSSSSTPTRIIYNDQEKKHDQVSAKVGIGMILRYQTFYINALIYLWLRRNSFDIIHVHMIEWPAFIGVKLGKALRKPTLLKDSTMNGIFNILRYPNGKKKRQDISDYAHFIAMTAVIKNNYLQAGIPNARITLIPNGIEVTPLPVKKKRWSDKVIFVGNLTQQPAKGIDILLLAWKEVIQKRPAATLSIIGNGDLDAYRKFAEEQGIQSSVIFMGKQENVRSLLLASDLFVLPSRREGMSNALLEAMICAMPVVATNVSGNEDLIVTNVSGLLVPPANIDKLSEAILFMLQNPERAIMMGQTAYQSVTEKCDMNKVTKDYIQLYKQITNPA